MGMSRRFPGIKKNVKEHLKNNNFFGVPSCVPLMISSYKCIPSKSFLLWARISDRPTGNLIYVLYHHWNTRGKKMDFTAFPFKFLFPQQKCWQQAFWWTYHYLPSGARQIFAIGWDWQCRTSEILGGNPLFSNLNKLRNINKMIQILCIISVLSLDFAWAFGHFIIFISLAYSTHSIAWNLTVVPNAWKYSWFLQ